MANLLHVDQPMFDWVKVNIVHERSEVFLIANQMSPIPALPYSSLATSQTHIRTPFRARKPLREGRLDETPTQRIVAISFRQPDDAMQMFRKHLPTVDDKGKTSPNVTNRLAQQNNAICQKSFPT